MAKKDRAKKKHKKEQKRKAKKSKVNVQQEFRPSISEIDAPPGYRSLSVAQAIFEYAKPVLDYIDDEEDDINDKNEIFQIGAMLWNYSLSAEDNDKPDGRMLNAITGTLGLSTEEAKELVKSMVDRYYYLFPEEIQPPKRSNVMFIRKEMPTIIRPFDYSSVDITINTISPDKEDKALVADIKKLDKLIEQKADYDEYEDILFSVIETAESRFTKWLVDIGVEENLVGEFASSLNLYMTFVYAYMHDDVILLKNISFEYFEEFFLDYLIRKLIVDNPNEYVIYPPAIGLFYMFLYDKQYVDNNESEMIAVSIKAVEPYFIEVLQRQFT